MSPDSSNLAILWARLFVDALAEAGVREAVISPGSRSTPLVLALADHASIRVRVVLDEREAAFFALGTAKATGVPAVALSTSGSAPAHFFPAVVEASAARVPLILLTANRPPRLQLKDAPQTVDQARMYGTHARAFIDLGPPDARTESLRGLRQTAALAVAQSRSPEPGAVQVDIPFDKPLEPQPAGRADPDLEAELAKLRSIAFPRLAEGRPRLADGELDEIADRLSRSRRGIVLASALPAYAASRLRAAAELLERLALPLLVETSSQLRYAPVAVPRVGALGLAWSDDARLARFRPDFILQIGGVPASHGFERLLARHPEIPRVVVTAHGIADPYHQAALIVRSDPAEAISAIAARRPPIAAADGEWTRGWGSLESAAREACLELFPIDDAPLTEASAMRAALDALPTGTALGLSNSLPLRSADLFCAPDERDVSVFFQRGANGIDGLVAGAAGFAEGVQRPMLLLIGDLAFQHGVGGLAAARGAGVPLAIVVLANGGGRLFETLPLAASAVRPSTFERFFIAPQRFAVGAAAAAFEIPSLSVGTPAALRRAVAQALAERGPTVIEARLAAPHAADQLRALDRRVGQLLAE